MDWRILQNKARAKSQAPGASPKRPQKRVQQLALVVALVVVGAVGAGAWFFFNDGRDRVTAGGAGQTLTSNALDTAREVGAFVRENVTRDLSNIASFLRRSGGEPSDDGEADGAEDAETGTEVAAESLVRPASRLREPTKPPALQFGIERLAWAEIPPEPPLHMVFDNTFPEVTPPGIGDIRLRSEFLPGPAFESDTSSESKAESAEAALDSGAGFEQVGLVEVVVSETGAVERAKLISSPKNIHESMLLSAIKAWNFEPAQKDGQAVRYRQVMPITVAR